MLLKWSKMKTIQGLLGADKSGLDAGFISAAYWPNLHDCAMIYPSEQTKASTLKDFCKSH